MGKLDMATLGRGEVGKVAIAAGTADAAAQLRQATAISNAHILTGIRDIIRMQINQLTAASARGEIFDSKQSSTLLRLAQTYAILDSSTSKEQKKYDVSDESDAALADAEAAARRILGTE